MSDKPTERRKDADGDDQYSQPACRSRLDPAAARQLGPDTKQLLGVLKSLQDDDAE